MKTSFRMVRLKSAAEILGAYGRVRDILAPYFIFASDQSSGKGPFADNSWQDVYRK